MSLLKGQICYKNTLNTCHFDPNIVHFEDFEGEFLGLSGRFYLAFIILIWISHSEPFERSFLPIMAPFSHQKTRLYTKKCHFGLKSLILADFKIIYICWGEVTDENSTMPLRRDHAILYCNYPVTIL